MENKETTKLHILREWVGRLAAECTDEDLLDLIAKLLLTSSAVESP